MYAVFNKKYWCIYFLKKTCQNVSVVTTFFHCYLSSSRSRASNNNMVWKWKKLWNLNLGSTSKTIPLKNVDFSLYLVSLEYALFCHINPLWALYYSLLFLSLLESKLLLEWTKVVALQRRCQALDLNWRTVNTNVFIPQKTVISATVKETNITSRQNLQICLEYLIVNVTIGRKLFSVCIWIPLPACQ